MLELLVQPLAAVPFTLYKVDVAGIAVTTGPEVALNPADGDQI